MSGFAAGLCGRKDVSNRGPEHYADRSDNLQHMSQRVYFQWIPLSRFGEYVRIDETTHYDQYYAGDGRYQDFERRLDIVPLLDDPVLPEQQDELVPA